MNTTERMQRATAHGHARQVLAKLKHGRGYAADGSVLLALGAYLAEKQLERAQRGESFTHETAL